MPTHLYAVRPRGRAVADGVCHRCGMPAERAHPSESECVVAIDKELRAIRLRAQELRAQRVSLINRQLDRRSWAFRSVRRRSAGPSGS